MQATVMAVAVVEMFIYSKFGTKTSGDGNQDIVKDTESHLGSVTGIKAEVSFVRAVRDDDREIRELNKLSALHCFSFRPGHFFV